MSSVWIDETAGFAAPLSVADARSYQEYRLRRACASGEKPLPEREWRERAKFFRFAEKIRRHSIFGAFGAGMSAKGDAS